MENTISTKMAHAIQDEFGKLIYDGALNLYYSLNSVGRAAAVEWLNDFYEGTCFDEDACIAGIEDDLNESDRPGAGLYVEFKTSAVGYYKVRSFCLQDDYLTARFKVFDSSAAAPILAAMESPAFIERVATLEAEAAKIVAAEKMRDEARQFYLAQKAELERSYNAICETKMSKLRAEAPTGSYADTREKYLDLIKEDREAFYAQQAELERNYKARQIAMPEVQEEISLLIAEDGGISYRGTTYRATKNAAGSVRIDPAINDAARDAGLYEQQVGAFYSAAQRLAKPTL